jgi:cephalosporin-C deacetylase-like acetyl esterase
MDKALGQKFLPAASDMLTFTTISQKLHEMDVEADLAWTKLANRADYDSYRKQMHRKMMAAMGEWPERTPLNARTVATLKKEGYRIEKVIFESMPKLFVTANLFIPDSPRFKAPYPAVVMSCGHANEGKDCNIYLRACVHAVRNGFVALMYDPYEQGERRQFKGIGSTGHHNIIGVKASLIGWSMPMLRTWDGMRAVDYAESRAEVDKDRIGFMGQSGGGTMTALMTAADWRLKATAPSCYLTSLRHLCESMGPQDAEQNIFGQLAFGLNHTGYVLLPDTKVAVTCRFRDMFSIYGTLDLFRTVKTLAAKIGTYDHYALNSAPGPHGWTESTEVASIDWMRAWLKDETEVLPLDCAKYRPLDIGFDVKTVELGLSEAERGVTPTKRTMDLPGARDIHTIMRDRLAAIVKARPAYSAAERNAIAAKLAGVKKPSDANATVKELPAVDIDGAKLTRVTFAYPDGLYIPACWVVPAKPNAAKAPVIMIGANGRADWAADVEACLAEGASVLVADITGYGEIGKEGAVFYGAKNCPEEGASVMLYLMGESMTGRRATDMLVLADWVKAKTGSVPALVAKGSAAIPAAHARAASAEAFAKVSVSEAPMSWTEFIEKGDTTRYHYTYMVVNGLCHYDWTDLLK